jgi:hypothetical protein
MAGFGDSELDAAGIAFPVVNRLDRFAPAWSSRQFDREHPLAPPGTF